MMSSTLVSALAPHWSVRIRRNKRGVACTDIGVVCTATSEPGQEPQGSGLEVGEGGTFLKLHDTLGTDSVGQQQQQQFLETQNQRVGERRLTLGSQAHERASTLGSSRSTVGGWFEGSTPSHKLDHPTKAPVSNSVSLDVSWGRLDNRGVEGGIVFPVTPTSPFSSNLNVHRGVSQADRQGDQPSPLSSKLTTSSHLLSLRRLNTIASSTHLETNAPSISSPINHRDGETSGTHLSPTVNNDRASKTIRAHLSLTSSNDGDRERSKSLPYSASPTYRTTERSRPLPLPTSNHREADTHRTHLFSTSPNYQNREGTPRTNLPQTSRVYPNKTFPGKQTLLFSGVERRPPLERSGGTTVHLSSSPPSQYGHLDFLRSQPLPRGTTLRSTSLRKYTGLEDSVSNPSSPLLSPTTTTTINHNNNHTSSLSSTSSTNNTGPCSTNDVTSVNPQSSINNNNHFVTPKNTNLNSNSVSGKHTTLSTQIRSDAENIPNQNSFNSNDKKTQKPYNLSNIPFSSNTWSIPKRSSTSERFCRPSNFNSSYTPLTVFRPNSHKTPTSPETSETLSSHRTAYKSHSLSKTSSSIQPPKSPSKSPLFSLGKSRIPVGVQLERSPPSLKMYPKINTLTSVGSTPNPSSRQLSAQTSNAPTSLSSHGSLYSSRSLNTTSSMSQSSQNTPKSPPPVVRSQIPIVQNTHTAPFQQQSPKTAYTPTTIPQPLILKTSYVPSNPTPYTQPLSPASYTPISLSMTTTQEPSTPPLSPLSTPPLGERTFTGSLARSPKKHQYPMEERVKAHRARQESLEPQRSEETSRRLSQSHSRQSPADLTSSTAPTRPLRSVGCPAIFSSLRLGSPTWAMSLLSPQTPRTTKLEVWRGDSMHNLSIMSDTTVKEGGRAPSERVSDHTSRFTFDHTGTDSTALGPQRKTSAPLSLPDFGSFYKPRLSSLPYSTLRSSRTTLGEVPHTTSPQTPLSPSTSPQTPLSPSTSPQRYPFYSHRRNGSRDSSKVVALETDSVINNSKQTSEDDVETLVYRISQIDSSTILDSIRLAQPCFPQHTPDTRVVTDIKSNELSHLTSDLSQSSQYSQVIGSPSCQSYQSSNDSGPLDTEKVVCNMESILKSAVAPLQTQSPTKEAEKGWKGRNKMDLVLSRLQQTFRVNRLDDERRERTPQPSSVSSASHISDGTDCSKSSDQAEEDRKDRWRENDGVLKPSYSFWAGSERTSDMTKENVRCEHSQGLKDNKEARNRDQPCVMDLPQFEAYNDKSFTLPRNQPSRTEFSPTRRQFEAYKEERISRAKKQPPQRDFSPVRHQPWDPSHSASLPAYRSSSGSPRNTFSVFHFSHEDSKNDNVFHFNHEDSKNNNVLLSPRLPRRKKSTFLGEPGEGGFGSRVGQCGSEGRLASFSSCANLKYGLEAGRSFSVSSVLSSRPSGPGRISTGPRISSVSDPTDPALTFGEEDMTWDDLRVKGDWVIPVWDTHTTTSHKTTGDSQAVKTTGDSQAVNNWSVISDQTSKNERKTITANFTDARKSRSKSLPRNVSWGSEVTCPSPTTTSTITGRMWNPGSLETSHFLWDTGRSATAPPSPLWSPASRRISRPPSSSSSASPSPTDRRVSQDSLSPRGRLPSRGYVSSLAAFEESDSDSASDMDSDTTTDDEYCLAGVSGEKETEL